MNEQRALSVNQAAARWGVSARHIYDLCATGKLGHLRIGSLIRIRLSDIEAYEARQWHAPSPIDQPSTSSSAEVVSMSVGGRMARNDAFRRGQRIAGKPNNS
jgi:excisionase family DNA binding protein